YLVERRRWPDGEEARQVPEGGRTALRAQQVPRGDRVLPAGLEGPLELVAAPAGHDPGVAQQAEQGPVALIALRGEAPRLRRDRQNGAGRAGPLVGFPVRNAEVISVLAAQQAERDQAHHRSLAGALRHVGLKLEGEAQAPPTEEPLAEGARPLDRSDGG